MKNTILTYLEISPHTKKNSIGIQKQAIKIPITKTNLIDHPASWTIAAQLFLGRIDNRIMMWKIKRAKVILNTDDVPKQAVTDSSFSFEVS